MGRASLIRYRLVVRVAEHSGISGSNLGFIGPERGAMVCARSTSVSLAFVVVAAAAGDAETPGAFG